VSLTGVPLLVLLFLVAAAVPLATLHPWFVRRTMRRLGLILAAQLTAVALVAAVANDYGDFYPSWSDLFHAVHADTAQTHSFGAATGDPPSADLPRAGPGELPAAQAVTTAAALSPTGWSNRGEWPQRGAVVHLPTAADPNGPPQEVLAYLPPVWFSGTPGATALPVVEVLTGYPGTPDTEVHKLHAPDSLLAGIRSGALHPMVLLMTRPVEPFPRDTECTDVPAGPASFSFLADTLPDSAARALHLQVTAMAAVGYSTGGYCSLKLAMLRPARFAGGASMSGYYAPDPGINSGDLYGGSSANKNANDLSWRLTHLPPPHAAILVVASREERFESGYAAAQQFLSLVRAPLAAQEIVLDRGGHNFDTWDAEFPRILPWLDGQVRHRPIQVRAAPTPSARAGP
jgi:hypothetical protein